MMGQQHLGMLQQSFIKQYKKEEIEKLQEKLNVRAKWEKTGKKNYVNELKENVKGSASASFENSYAESQMSLAEQEIKQFKVYIKELAIREKIDSPYLDQAINKMMEPSDIPVQTQITAVTSG